MPAGQGYWRGDSPWQFPDINPVDAVIFCDTKALSGGNPVDPLRWRLLIVDRATGCEVIHTFGIETGGCDPFNSVFVTVGDIGGAKVFLRITIT